MNHQLNDDEVQVQLKFILMLNKIGLEHQERGWSRAEAQK